ncbi:MAG TPA: THUMP domain-containing protein [candidate division Zixibacteria bacterium]|nr:THUMP domain-containing protein [candidate division Zixibacteria bacterium]
MADETRRNAKLIVTSMGLAQAREARRALARAVPGARITGTGLKGVFSLQAEGDPLEIARIVYRECGAQIGHVTAVLAEVDSKLETIRQAAVDVGAAQIGKEETFSFRIHKRGAHYLEQDTSVLEREIGGAIWQALRAKHGVEPRVRLKDPDVAVVAEVLGPVTAVGISRKAWHEQPPAGQPA